MLAFVDESGDPGRKILNGSSKYFVVAVVTFSSNDEALSCDYSITDLRSELSLPAGYEFHFTENSKSIREFFLQKVYRHAFYYHVFALDKDPGKLYGAGFNHKESLYQFAVRLTFENASPYLDNASVVIDRSGDRKFRDQLATYLTARIKDADGNKIIKKVKTQNSHGNNLLQLADYVASVSNRAISGKPDGLQYRQRYLERHELTRQIWPK